MQSKRTPRRRKKFLEALKTFNGRVTQACTSLKLSRNFMYDWKKDDEDFSAEWDQVVEEQTEALEEEAWRRAHEGVTNDVFYQGQVIGQERTYSDGLLQFLLRGRKPSVYRDNSRVELGGLSGGPLVIEVEFVEEKSSELEDSGQ